MNHCAKCSNESKALSLVCGSWLCSKCRSVIQEWITSKEPELKPKTNGSVAPKRLLTDLWMAAYLEHFQTPYLFNGEKDGQAADRLLKLGLPPEQILAVAIGAWDHGALFNCKQASSLAGFAGRFNEIRAELLPASGEKLSMADLRAKLKACEDLATEIKNRYSSEVAMGTTWDNPAKHKEYLGLRAKIKSLKERMTDSV